MRVKRFLTSLIFVVSVLFLVWQFFIVPNVNFENVMAVYSGGVYMSSEEVKNLSSMSPFGSLIKASAVSKVSKENAVVIDLKLFNIFKLKKVKVNVVSDCNVYGGGDVLNFKFSTSGVVVTEIDSVLTQDGKRSDLTNAGVQVGDVITMVEEQLIEDARHLVSLIENSKKNEILLKIRRNGVEISKKVQIFKDIDDKMRLGLWVKDDFSGVGTLTYVRKDNLEFGAVGHRVVDAETGANVDVNGGEICEASVVGVKKGRKGEAGELRVFGDTASVIGGELKNLDNGIFGKVNEKFNVNNRNTYSLVSRLSVKPGKVKILSCLNGKNVEEFDAEIIKLSKQSIASQKGILLRITDKRLLNSSGGIVQGMSGSPIIQNGNFVGAVTHVMVDNPSLGYGIFSEWMMQS